MSEAFVKTLKRDYASTSILPDADTILDLRPKWIDDYCEVHRLNWLGRKSIAEGSWLDRLARRKPRMLVAVALANKMARTIWAMVTKQQDYRDPAKATAAC